MQIATPFLRQQTLQAHFHQSIHRIGKGRVHAEGEKAHGTGFAQLRILLVQHRNLRTDGMQVGLEQLHVGLGIELRESIRHGTVFEWPRGAGQCVRRAIMMLRVIRDDLSACLPRQRTADRHGAEQVTHVRIRLS